MGVLRMIQRMVYYSLLIIVLFVVSNLLAFPINLIRQNVDEYVTQIAFSSLSLITLLIIEFVRISKDNDLHRDITAIINKSEKEYSLRNTYFEYMKKYGIKEIICFMTSIYIINLLYININTEIDNIMNEVFIYMYNLLKFIYSNDAPLGSFNTYILLNYILIVVLFTIVFSVIMCYTITKCEENRLHKKST